MLTLKKLKEINKYLKEQEERVQYFLFVNEETGNHYGLVDGEILDDGVKIVFTKKIKSA